MLGLPKNPIKTELIDNNRLIILTKNQILFTHLDEMDNYLSLPIIGNNPLHFHHSPSSLQTLLQTETTIEIIYCDWKMQVRLIRVIVLMDRDRAVEGVWYDPASGWNILGSDLEYPQAKINFINQSCSNSLPSNSKILSRCSVAENHYILTKQQLLKSNPDTQHTPKRIPCKDLHTTIKGPVSMSGHRKQEDGYVEQKQLICINGTVVLVVAGWQVLHQIVETPAIMAISHFLYVCSASGGEGKLRVKKVEDRGETVWDIDDCNIGVIRDVGIAYRKGKKEIVLVGYQNNALYLHYSTISDSELTSTQINPRNSNTMPQVQPKVAPLTLNYQSQNYESEKPPEDQSPKETKNLAHLNYDIKGNASLPNIFLPEFRENRSSENSLMKIKSQVREIFVEDQRDLNDSFNQGDSQVLSRSALGDDRKNDFGEEDSFNQNLKRKPSRQSERDQKVELNMSEEKSEKFGYDQDVSIEKDEKIMNDGNSFEFKRGVSSSRKISSKSKPFIKDHDSFEEGSLTPGFGFEGNFGFDGNFGGYQNQWDVQEDQIIQKQEDEQFDRSQAEQANQVQDIDQIFSSNSQQKNSKAISKKVQYFLPSSLQSDPEEVRKIELCSYCKLIDKESADYPEKFEQLARRFLPELLEEAEVTILFSDHMRNFSHDSTKDKIKRIFHEYLGREDMKKAMTNSLKQLQLAEVPDQVLDFSKDFIKILKMIYKEIYISDLLSPTEITIEYILESYFIMDSFPEEVISIEDEFLEISHPRNILNILLYLNQSFNLHISLILKTYCSKLLQHNCIDVLQQVIDEEVFQICEVPISILDEPVVDRFNDLLRESVENAGYLWEIIPFLRGEKVDEFRMRVAVICQLNSHGIVFDLQLFINLKEVENSTFKFMDDLIENNGCLNMMKLRLDSLYRSIYWIEKQQKLIYQTPHYVQLIMKLSQKMLQRLRIQSFKLLESILEKIKISYIGRLLILYLDSKLLNRVADVGVNEPFRLRQIFPEFFPKSNVEVDLSKLARDSVNMPRKSSSFSCSYDKFKNIYRNYYDSSLEMEYLTFVNIEMAKEIHFLGDEKEKGKFKNFFKDIEKYLLKDLKVSEIAQNSLQPRDLTPIKFSEELEDDLQSNAASSFARDELMLIDEGKKNNKVYKSMTIVDHYNTVSVKRTNSDVKKDDGSEDNEELKRLKLLVNRKQIRKCLEEIYEMQPQQVFLKALFMIDLEKNPLYHLDTFRQICAKETEILPSKIFCFQIFHIENDHEAFMATKKQIQCFLSVQSFWIIYMLVEMMFGEGTAICESLILMVLEKSTREIEKQIVQLFKDIFSILKPKLNPLFINNAIKQADKKYLFLVSKQLEKYAIEIDKR